MSVQQIPGTFFENAPQIIKTDENYTLGLSDGVVNVDGPGVTVTLPPQPRIGDRHVISANAGDVSVSGGSNPIVGGAVVVSNGTSVQYVFNALGQWEALTGPFGAFGQGEIIVPNIAALAALPAASLPNHVYARPLTVDQAFELEKTDAQTPDGITIVAAAGGGNWLRILSPVPRFTEQLTWFVDPVSGNDENVGSTALTAIKTVAEFARRMIVANFNNYTINILNDVPASDILHLSPWSFEPVPAPNTATRAVFLFKGIRTAVALPAGAGVVTAATDTNPALYPQTALAQATLTDANIGGWAAHVGQMIVITSGASAGAVAWVLKDLGGNVARVSNWWSTTTITTVAPPLPGDTYQLVTMTKWNSTLAAAGRQSRYALNFQDIEFTGTVVVQEIEMDLVTTKHSGAGGQATGSFIFRNDVRPTTNGILVQFTAFATSTMFAPITLRAQGSAFINVNMGITKQARGDFQDCVFQSSTVSVGFAGAGNVVDTPVQSGQLGTVGSKGLGVFDSPAGRDGVTVQRGANAFLLGPLYGFGNTLFGLQVKNAGQVYVNPTVTPTITGTSGDLRIENSATAIPQLVAGAPVPAALPLSTWAPDWSVTFGRNVMSYRSSAQITNALP